MKINLLQTDIVWASLQANHEHAEKMMRSMESADLYILPEMFSTGFATQPEGIAEDMQNGTTPSIEWMKKMACELDAAIAGSVAIREEDGRYYNRFCFVHPDGECTFYDKHHLFTYGGEHHRYTAGQERVVAEFRGVRFLLQICYDLRFPNSPSGGMVGPAEGKSHREPVLCLRREPCGHRPLLPVFWWHTDDRPLWKGGSAVSDGRGECNSCRAEYEGTNVFQREIPRTGGCRCLKQWKDPHPTSPRVALGECSPPEAQMDIQSIF